jgi:hypothetical protein
MPGYAPRYVDKHNYYELNQSNKIEALSGMDEIEQQFDSNIAKLNEYTQLSSTLNDQYNVLSQSIVGITTHPLYNAAQPVKPKANLADHMKRDSKAELEMNKQMMMLGTITLASLFVLFAYV